MYMRKYFLLILLISSALCADAQVPEPVVSAENRPFVRWWWLGSAVDEEGITWNLEEFASAGLGGVEITPIYGVKDNERNDVEYLSPIWIKGMLPKNTLGTKALTRLKVYAGDSHKQQAQTPTSVEVK